MFWYKPYSASFFSPGEVGDCTSNDKKSRRQGTREEATSHQSKGKDWPFEMCSAFWAVCLEPPSWPVIVSQPSVRVRRAITQASNVMIESSLLKTRIRLLQCYDWKPTALCVSQNGSFQSPCSLWEQEFRSSTDIRQPSTVNRVLVSCSGVIGNSLLLVCHTERRPQSPCSMWEQELNRYYLCYRSTAIINSFTLTVQG